MNTRTAGKNSNYDRVMTIMLNTVIPANKQFFQEIHL